MKRMRKPMIYVLMMALLLVSLPCERSQAQTAVPVTKAHAYCMVDAGSGEKILSKHANKKIYPASTVKLMTAIVVLDHAKESQEIKYTKKLRKMVPYDAASLNLRTGRTYHVNQYLHMLLMVSDAASAITLAVGIAGSQQQFVEWMNDKAEELGMKHSSFDNPIGLDKGNGYNKTYTTAADFIKVSREAMKNNTIRHIVAKKKYTVRPIGVNKSFVIKNTNAFYFVYKKMVKGKSYQIIGSKTGTTKAAGHALIATAQDEEGHEVICAFFGNSSHEQLYKDVKKLFDYAFAQYQ